MEVRLMDMRTRNDLSNRLMSCFDIDDIKALLEDIISEMPIDEALDERQLYNMHDPNT
jgi:hypothetical protein